MALSNNPEGLNQSGELPQVSVIMPTYKQAHFIRRALTSLLAQTFTDWELIIIDDGSPDSTYIQIASFLQDNPERVRYHRFEENRGLGAALNYGLDAARAAFIAYLPSDDIYFPEHLASLLSKFNTGEVSSIKDNSEGGSRKSEINQPTTRNPNPPTTDNPAPSNNQQLTTNNFVAVFSGLRHHYNRSVGGQLEGYSLQLVQVMHRVGSERWLERGELTTDDLERMFWGKLRQRGEFVGTGQISCEWVNHPEQRHKIIQEPEGGINTYRAYYNVKQPLRFQSSIGNFSDEVERYRRFRERHDTPMAQDGLKILLVGELAYNADRVLALEEQGHQLYGLWMDKPYWYNAVGPMAFGHVEDLPRSNWQEALQKIQPDVIYALLNWQAVPFAHQVMAQNPAIPFIWHFKEGPFICREKGTWGELLDLYSYADGRIYSSPEMRDWFNTFLPENRPELILDGDLPKKDWFDSPRSPRLSDSDNQIHTVVPGRPIGLHPWVMGELAEQNIHVHFYGDYTQGQWKEWIDKVRDLAPNHLHLHPQVDQENWVSEFSKYDAGWLHFFKSENKGDLTRATWDDLNYPARIATLAVAGLPLLQGDNRGSIVATQKLVEELDLGLCFGTIAELGEQMRDRQRLDQLRENVWRQRHIFTFDYHAPRLIEFFRQVIKNHQLAGRGLTSERMSAARAGEK